MVNLDVDVVVQMSTMVVASSKVSTTMITHVDVSTIREQLIRCWSGTSQTGLSICCS
jgi:hypothetical protein